MIKEQEVRICKYILFQIIDKESVRAGVEDLKNEEKLSTQNTYDEDVQNIQNEIIPGNGKRV